MKLEWSHFQLRYQIPAGEIKIGDFRQITRNIKEMVQDADTVAIEG